ncbi:MAG: DUF4058 family protein [Oscillochloris sp.]|nr:DUF4058 family protein [Oscillochloris sp.]
MQEPLPESPYFVFLSRAERRPVLDIWPIARDQALPLIPVPLLAGDADILLDLQAAFTATYDLLGYDLLIEYRQPSQPALASADAAWADMLLQERGLRGTEEA